jgi:hypothetical protein
MPGDEPKTIYVLVLFCEDFVDSRSYHLSKKFRDINHSLSKENIFLVPPEFALMFRDTDLTRPRHLEALVQVCTMRPWLPWRFYETQTPPGIQSIFTVENARVLAHFGGFEGVVLISRGTESFEVRQLARLLQENAILHTLLSKRAFESGRYVTSVSIESSCYEVETAIRQFAFDKDQSPSTSYKSSQSPSASHSNEVDSIPASHSNEVDSIPASHSNEVDSIPASHSNEVDSIPASHSNEVDSIPVSDPAEFGWAGTTLGGSRPILDFLIRVASASWWQSSAKRGLNAVRLGASAPRRVRPGDQFTARLSAYHPAFKDAARKSLIQHGSKIRTDLLETTWRPGALVRVVLYGEHLMPVPPEQTFTWDGTIYTVDFDVTVDKCVTDGSEILLRFDLYVMQSVVARVRMSLSIDSKPSFLQQLLFSKNQFVTTQSPQTAYASYAVPDKRNVLTRIDALKQYTGIQFFTQCLALNPTIERRQHLRKIIADQDLFMLFWSRDAAQSPDVEWEWTTALKNPGRGRMEAQRLQPNDPDPVLPPELLELETAKVKVKIMQSTERKFFVVGCVLSVFVGCLIIWAFAVGTLTSDQRTLIRTLLSLFSGFSAGCFVGALTVAATATGGFGVWLLTAFVMLSTTATFDVVVQPHGPAGILDTLENGTVSLQVGERLRRQSIDEFGQARFAGISRVYEGKKVSVGVKIPGFQMVNSGQSVELRENEPIAVPMVPQKP